MWGYRSRKWIYKFSSSFIYGHICINPMWWGLICFIGNFNPREERKKNQDCKGLILFPIFRFSLWEMEKSRIYLFAMPEYKIIFSPCNSDVWIFHFILLKFWALMYELPISFVQKCASFLLSGESENHLIWEWGQNL